MKISETNGNQYIRTSSLFITQPIYRTYMSITYGFFAALDGPSKTYESKTYDGKTSK